METSADDNITVMKLSGTGRSDARTDVRVRGLDFTIDEPAERGGADLGPTPPEALLAALIACTNRIARKIAAAEGIAIQNLTVDLEAAFDRRGVNLKHEVDIPFTAIALAIEVTTDADAAALEKLKTDLRKFCPISKIIRRAGTEITEHWTVRRP
jgi:uncharacterized OsmC-like protein